MSQAFLRCFAPDCDVWFKVSGEEKYCPLHSDRKSSLSAQVLPLTEISHDKEAYLARVNGERKTCDRMTVEELEQHILDLEKIMEDQKTLVLTARSVRADKLQKLTDEERAELRKVKITRAVKETSPKKTTMSKDPIAYLMENHKLTREQAMSMLGLK